MDQDGDFVVSWQSFGQDGSLEGIYAQRYAADGMPRGTEFKVNTHTTSQQSLPAIAMDQDGDFVVSWQTYGQDGSSYGLYARRYAADGTPLGTEFKVNTHTTNQQAFPAIALDQGGDFVVSWTSFGQDGSNSGIYAQRYAADGTPQGTEFQVNTYTTNIQSYPAIAMDQDGDFVVSWQSNGQDRSNYGIYAQRYARPASADLSVTQTDSADPVQLGASLTWSVTVTNSAMSAGAATGVQLRDSLPLGVSYTGFSADAEWSCAFSMGVVTCDYSVPLAIGASQVVDITADAPATVGRINNQVTVSATNPDPVLANNADGENTQVCDPAAVDAVRFLSSSSSKSENAGSALMNVSRSGNACNATSVSYSTANGTALADTDYTATMGSLNWSAGEQGKKSFSIPLSDDAVAEGNETLSATISGSAVASPSTHLLTIKDNDLAPTISLSSGDQSVSENGGIATITATISAARGSDLTVPLVISGTAKSGSDYVRSGNLLIRAGQTEGSITLTGTDDALDEADEIIGVAIGSVVGATPTGTTSNLVTLTDDDATPTVSFAKASDGLPEAKSNAGRIRLSAVSGRDVTVDLMVGGGSATAGADYTAPASVVIPAGKLEAFALVIVNDGIAEPDETVSLSISGASNATVGGIASHTHTIRNDD